MKGRADKKFCGDKCRSHYHYLKTIQQATNPNFVRMTNSILKRNRTILERAYLEGGSRVPKRTLLTMGFDFSYYTRAESSPTHQHQFFCYDIGYLLNKDQVQIIL